MTCGSQAPPQGAIVPAVAVVLLYYAPQGRAHAKGATPPLSALPPFLLVLDLGKWVLDWYAPVHRHQSVLWTSARSTPRPPRPPPAARAQFDRSQTAPPAHPRWLRPHACVCSSVCAAESRVSTRPSLRTTSRWSGRSSSSGTNRTLVCTPGRDRPSSFRSKCHVPLRVFQGTRVFRHL